MTSNWLTPSVSSLEFTVFFLSDDKQGDILNFVPLFSRRGPSTSKPYVSVVFI